MIRLFGAVGLARNLEEAPDVSRPRAGRADFLHQDMPLPCAVTHREETTLRAA